tara:strand:+ start:1356 stop:1634 length:279 start_codon:yes stop_codon:yes gene_type:complete
MNKLNILCLVTLAVGIGCLGYSNYKLNETVNSLNRHMEYNAMLSSDNAMRIEMFLQAMSNEFEDEVEAVVRPMIKKELDSIKKTLEAIKKNE